MINLNLTVEEINFLLHALGELPAKTNAWSLIVKIREQADPQVPVVEEDEETETNETNETNE